jgi:hypothetical protein
MKRIGQYLLVVLAGLAFTAGLVVSRIPRLDLTMRKTGTIGITQKSALDFGVSVHFTKNADGYGFSKEAWLRRVANKPTDIHIDMIMNAASGVAGFRL